MESQISLSSTPNNIPEKWQEKYLLKRIDEDDLELSLEERNAIIASLQAGLRFVQIRKYTIMVNAIKSIEPLYGERNIPPRPQEQKAYDVIEGKAILKIANQDELDAWDRLFGNRRGIAVL